MTILQQAKEMQRHCATNTSIVIKLALLEGLIAEIETLQHIVDVLREEHPAHKLRPVKGFAQKGDGHVPVTEERKEGG